jgi:hypothetical protein
MQYSIQVNKASNENVANVGTTMPASTYLGERDRSPGEERVYRDSYTK